MMVKTKSTYLILMALPLVLSGCSDTAKDELDEDVSNTGISLSMEADLPRSATTVNIAAAAYEDGDDAPLVGGDVLLARTEAEEKILQPRENRTNYYQNTLVLNNPSTSIELEVVFDAQGSRANRWYPTDELLVDPGPGSLVGYNASLTFPEEIQITEPQNDIRYTRREDEFEMQWLGSAADELSVVGRSTCYSDNKADPIDWVSSFNIDDDQSQPFTIADFIPEEKVFKTTNVFENTLTSVLQVFPTLFLDTLTFGLYKAETVNLDQFNLEYCTLNLSLVRKQRGTLGEGVSGGRVMGSRSDSIEMEYRP